MKKRILVTTIMLAFIAVGYAQPGTPKQTKRGEVSVLNWGGRTVTLLPTFWTAGIDEQLLSQLGPEQLEDIKKNCQEKSWPDGFAVSKRGNNTETSTTLEDKLAKLKLIRIATFDNIRNGTNYGEMSVVLVSPKENEGWNPGVKWDKNLYFLFFSKDLQLVK